MQNWWQILVAAIPYFILGSIWYNPKVFGTAWASGHGLEMDEAKKKEVNMGKLFGMAFFFSIILSAVICWVCCQGGAAICANGEQCKGCITHCIACGFIVGMGSFATMGMNYTFLMKPARVFFIDGGYHIIGGILISIVLHLLGCC